jgi:hypothetical protein
VKVTRLLNDTAAAAVITQSSTMTAGAFHCKAFDQGYLNWNLLFDFKNKSYNHLLRVQKGNVG